MKTPEREIFFVGYLPLPKGLRGFLPALALLLIGLFAGLGFAVSATQDDPGDGAFRFDWGRQTVTGILRANPYPTLTLSEGTERFAAGHTIMLAGQGKRGAGERADALDGQLATASGVALKRGSLDMLQLRGGEAGLSAAEGTPYDVEDIPLGRWRVTGEICDGKCLAGAMRPGRGIAHKACANLCLIGGVPPVLVSTGEIDGTAFLLLAGADGGPVGTWMLDAVARLVELEGNVVRRGDLLIFKADPASLKVF
ncbi:MAG: hypothetical protein AAFR79_03445 [Pseudomonadota bacterium]